MKIKTADLIGTWDLVRYELLPPNEPSRPLWDSFRGRLVYTQEGTVSVLVVKIGAAEFQNSEVIAYSGQFKVEGDEVVHEIFVSNLAHYLDRSLMRKASLLGDDLVLLTTELVKGAIHRVTWRKLAPGGR